MINIFEQLFKKTQYAKLKKDAVMNIPEGMWIKCGSCKSNIYANDLEETKQVCPSCGYHMPLSAWDRIELITDNEIFIELDENIQSLNPIDFPDYERKTKTSTLKTGLKEAVITGIAKINTEDVVLAVMDSRYMMGSMGSAVGEKITRAVEKSIELRYPLVIFCASGGARMQESIFSLMQMAKTSAALGRHKEEGLLYITVLTHPTTGGVTASFAMLGDIILAEPKALIGFAGPRVIEQTIRQRLPEGFQSAEFLKEKGFVDKIVERKDLKTVLSKLIFFHKERKEA
nr:acetyl-CoA carboxylase, carboxyltransferase subunit beta [Acetoanaerobium sticklandii]